MPAQVIVLLLLAGIPMWVMLWINDSTGLIFIWAFTLVSCFYYFFVRGIEKEKNYTVVSRKGLGFSLLAKSGAVTIASLIAFKNWPIHAILTLIISIFLLIEAQRLIKGWKLFLPVKE